MATQIKKTRTLLAPKFNDKGQITGSWGKQINTYQTEVQSKAWSAYGWPDWKGGSFYVENPMTNGQGQSLDQILAGNKRMINIPTPTDNTVSSNRYVTSPPSAVVAGGNNFVNQTVGAMSDWLPQATVATPKNPVVSRTTNKTDVGYSPTDYSDIDSYDLKGLNDYTRSLQYDQMNWVKLTKEQYLKMQRAIERAQELQSPAKTPNPLEPIIQQQQDTQAQLKGELEQQNQQDYQAQSDAENAWVQQELAYNQQQENTQKNTLGYILWAQWAGTSSYAVDKINEIGQNFARQNQTLRAESFARLQKYKAEQAGATRAELAKYDQNILQLQMKGAEFTVDNAQKLNEFNQEQAKSTEERLNNILQLAQAQMAEWTPLTDQEKAQAKQYWQLLIDAKGGINEALLKLIPPHLMSEALAQGALSKWAAESQVSKDDFITLKVVAGRDDRWNPIEKEILYNPKTQETIDPSSGGSNGTGQPSPQKTTESSTTPTNSVELIKRREWFRDKAYQDSVWKRTVGYWFTSLNWKPVKQWDTIDRATADKLLRQEISQRQNFMKYVTVPLTESQKAALSSFEFNLWSGIWEKNAMPILNKLNQGDLQWAAQYLKQYANWWGKFIQGLANRRNEEASLLVQTGTSWIQPPSATELKRFEDWIVEKGKLTPQRYNEIAEYQKANQTTDIKPLSDDQRVVYNNQLGSFRWNAVVKSFEEGMQQYTDILASLGDNTWPGDVAAIFQFMKTLDPSSVVRETEFETAAKSAWVANYLGNTFNRLAEGKKLTPEQSKAFGKLAKKYVENRAKNYDRLYDDFARVTKNMKIDDAYLPTRASDALRQNSENNVTPSSEAVNVALSAIWWDTLDDLYAQYNK